jgi:hypothetical protein
MATEDGRKQAKVKRDKPIVEGNTGNSGSRGQIDDGRSEQTISNLIQGFQQLIEEHNEIGFQLSRLGAVAQGKAREYAKELERIKAMK